MDVIVGTVGKAHGIRGEVVIVSRTDDPQDRFAVGRQLRRGDGGSLSVAAMRRHGGALVVGFAGVTDRSAAEALRGAELWVSLADEPPAADSDEFHDSHLIGLRALDQHGQEVGTVRMVQHLPAQDVLVLAGANGERLVPFVTELVPEVDIRAGYLTINAIPGLLAELPVAAEENDAV
ncbi:MAG: ribosome maturation factor RimM [Propionibacteriaceae bacterium]|jgi:16S rRNA processing protein RimM|nr:ribosome maturation factor RimM [Propionibacteriaceae bacterium]